MQTTRKRFGFGYGAIHQKRKNTLIIGNNLTEWVVTVQNSYKKHTCYIEYHFPLNA